MLKMRHLTGIDYVIVGRESRGYTHERLPELAKCYP
jgi:hypothetical protein